MSSDAIKAALQKAKGEAGAVEADKQAARKADRTGKPVETASGAPVDHPLKEVKPSSTVPSPVTDADKAAFADTKGDPQANPEPTHGADPFTSNPDEVLAYAEREQAGELNTGVLTPADVGPATLVVDDVEIPVVINHVDADGTPTLDEKSSKAVDKVLDKSKGANKSTGEVLTDRVKLQPPAESQTLGEWGAFANFALLPPVDHNK